MQCSSLCFTDSTVVQILAVYVLLSSSESVGTHCIFANVSWPCADPEGGGGGGGGGL